jgi:tetratricopeptide (TPR) repeat protein
MFLPEEDSSAREHRLDEVIAEYYQLTERGQPVDPQAFLSRYPELADELSAFLADKADFDLRVGTPLPPTTEPATEPIPPPAPMTVPPPKPADDTALGLEEDTALPDARRHGQAPRFGDFELVEEIARGSMGIVWRAVQLSLNRAVALKLILAERLASPADVARFRAEAEAAGNLDHPNILPLYEVGEHAGQHYYTMKLIRGGSLAEQMGDFVGDPTRAVQVLVQVARAVHHAHQRGILHRDLKPANILLDIFGTPHVTDFGLTRWMAIVGTPAYMCPEQARADRHLTTASDVWSLGAILYECLTGQPPFPGDSVAQTLLAVLEKEPVPPRHLRPELPRELDVICLKCLQKEPGQRYQSAGDLGDDLARWLHPEQIQDKPSKRSEPLVVKRVRWRPAVAAVAAALMLLCLAAAGGMYWQSRQIESARRYEAESAINEQAASRSAAVTAEVVLFQHRGEARLAGRQPEEAIADFTEAIKKEPNCAACWAGRGEGHAMRGQWKEAGQDLDRALALGPATLAVWDHRLLVHLAAGQTDDYRKTLAKMIERFGRSGEPETARVLALGGVRIPDAVDEVTLLRLVFTGTGAEVRTPDQRFTIGAGLYRANRIAAALLELQAAEKGRTQPEALDALFTALAYARLGKKDEARAALRRAGEIIDMAESKKMWRWQQRVAGEALRREAEELVQ